MLMIMIPPLDPLLSVYPISPILALSPVLSLSLFVSDRSLASIGSHAILVTTWILQQSTSRSIRCTPIQHTPFQHTSFQHTPFQHTLSKHPSNTHPVNTHPVNTHPVNSHPVNTHPVNTLFDTPCHDTYRILFDTLCKWHFLLLQSLSLSPPHTTTTTHLHHCHHHIFTVTRSSPSLGSPCKGRSK